MAEDREKEGAGLVPAGEGDSSKQVGVFPNTTSGAWPIVLRGGLPRCDTCFLRTFCDEHEAGASCRTLAVVRENMITAYMAEPGIKAIDYPLVAQLVNLQLFTARVSAYAAYAGELLPGHAEGFGELQPCLGKGLLAFVNTARHLAAELGLTPRARRELERQASGGVGEALASAIRAAANPPGPVADADFTAETD